jgi:hypothetical protein
MIYNAPVGRIAIENPIGWMNTNWRKPDQIIQPWMFGDPYVKATCLWLRDLPLLEPVFSVKPEGVVSWVTDQHSKKDSSGKRIWASEGGIRRTDSVTRSKTFPGIARAMAEQWG